MENNKYDTQDVKTKCEKKLGIEFRCSKEFNGWFYLDGRKTVRITVSKGRKEIPPGTYRSMAKQLNLTVEQFDLLLACPLGREEYERIVRNVMK